MPEPQAVAGISVPLSIDRSRWSAELKAARQEYDQFRSHISRGGAGVGAGVGRVSPGVVGSTAGVHAPAGPPMATVGNVSPRFNVSAGAVRDMRIEINKQLRTFAAQGEAINIPIRLGRVNYGAIRSEISAGIGLVPIKVTLDPSSIAAIRGQIVGAMGPTGAGGKVSPGQTALPIARRRASGGAVSSGYPRRAAAGPVKGPGGADLARYPEALMERNLIRLLNSLTERDIKAGRLWYPSARGQLLEGAQREGFLDLGPKKQQQGRIIAATASVSPQMKWFANLAHSRAVARAAVQGTQPTKAMADANLPWVRQLLGPRSKVSAGVMGLGAREREHAMRLIHGESPESVLQRIKGGKPTGELLPKVYPFSRNLGGDLSMLTLDSIAAQTATSGLPSWVKGAGYAQAPPAGVFRDAMARVHEKVYREHAQGLFPGGIAEMQAALWTRYRGEEFARGGHVPSRARGTPRRGGFCSTCRTNVRDPLLHRSTAKHIANVRGPSRGSGNYLRGRPSWMNALRDPGGDEEGYEERATSYPGGKWYPGRSRGTPRPAFRQVPAERFHQTISEASNVVRGSGRRVGETVSTYPLEEYAAMRTYLNAAGTAGYAIKPDGDLVSVFNVGAKGGGKSAIRSAIQRGATKLDAFDEVGTMGAITHPVHPHDVQKNLPKFYGQFGFREVGRDPWDPQYAPEGWTGGTPDVVYMQRRAKGQQMQRGGPLVRATKGFGRFPEGFQKSAMRQFGALTEEYGFPVKLGRAEGLLGRTNAFAYASPTGAINFNPAGVVPATGKYLAKGHHGDTFAHEYGHIIDDRLKRGARNKFMRGATGNADPEEFADLFMNARRGYGDPHGVLDFIKSAPRSRLPPVLNRLVGDIGQKFGRLFGTPRGEGANLSLRVGDPEGLHLRPASALARVGQMAELSGNPIRVTNEAAGKTIGYPATGSVIGWTALLGGPRQGHKLNISVGGTETARVLNLLEKLIGFEGPAKTGQSYHEFHSSLGLGSALTAKIDAQQRTRLGKMQDGGPLKLSVGKGARWSADTSAIDALERMFPNAKVDLGRFSKRDLESIVEAAGPLAGKYPATAANLRAIAFSPETVRARDSSLIAQLRPSQWDVAAGKGSVPYGSRMLFQNRAARQSPELRAQMEKQMVDPSIAGTFRHEFGHAVDYTHGTHPRYLAQSLDRSLLSPYAEHADLQEGFAELFGALESGHWKGVPFRRDIGPALESMSEAEHQLMAGEPFGSWYPGKRAYRKLAGGGGPDGEGMYVVNEIGREKFVPDRMAHMIPPDVFEQLPKRQEGGITEIDGHGPQLWQAPEDGWIIPARLAGKVPGRHQGGPAEAGHTHPHLNRPGTGYQDEEGRSVPDSAIVGRQPQQSSWRDIFRHGAPMQGPRVPSGGWAGAAGLHGNALRDATQGAAQGLVQGIQNLFNRPGTATSRAGAGAAPAAGPAAAPRQPPLAARPGPANLEEAVNQRRTRSAAEELEYNDDLSKLRADNIKAMERASIQREELFNDLPQGRVGEVSPLKTLERQARIAQTAFGASTVRTGVGRAFQSIFGGGEARREALIRGQGLLQTYQGMAPRGTPPGMDTTLAWGERLEELKDTGKVLAEQLEKTTTAGEGMTDQLEGLGVRIKQNTRDQATADEARKASITVGKEAEAQLKKAEGGALRYLGSLTLAGFAFSATSELLSTAIGAAVKATRPLVDEMTGFGATATRVTQQLGEALPQAGNIRTLMGQKGMQAGLSGPAIDFLTQRLGGGIQGVAGAQAAGQASDLFRAAQGLKAPTGVMGGYGGLFGGSFLATEVFGGGKGLAETVAGDIAVQRGQPGTPGLGGDLINNFSKAVSLLWEAGGEFVTGQDQRAIGVGRFGLGGGGWPVEVVNVDPKVNTEFLNNFNAALERGAPVGGGGAGTRLVEVGRGSEEARQVAAIPGLDEFTKDMAENGVVFKDATGALVTGLGDINKSWEQATRGFAKPSKEAFAESQALQIMAGREVAMTQRNEAITREIPAQLGEALAASPFMDAFAGLPGGRKKASPETRRELDQVNREQEALKERGREGIKTQARFIAEQSGPEQGARYTAVMGDITKLGQQIADINEAVANKQAAVSFKSYRINLHLLNRAISDARGLAGYSGGSAFGQMQRQQFMLGRESGRLSLQSQKLSLEANALSLELAQRQINYQKAVAGFAAPGVTPEEIAANVEAAEIEAEFAQKQLDIGKKQQGIGVEQYGISGRQFGLELQLFMESARRGVVDLEAQRELLVASHELEILQIESQKKIATRTARMGELQQEAQALTLEAQTNFNTVLTTSANFIAMFGGTAAVASAVIMTALTKAMLAGGTSGPTAPGPGSPTHAAGYSAYVNQPTSFIAGEAGAEQVLVIRNPRAGVMGGAGGGGEGGGETIVINISGNSFTGEGGLDELEERLIRAVDKAQGRKLALMGGRAS